MNGASNARDWKPTDDELDHLLQATNESANRVRQVLIVMATASIIVFAAVWNTMEFSWMRWRTEVATSMELWNAYQQDEKERARWAPLEAKVASGKASNAESKQLEKWKKALAAGERYAPDSVLGPAQIKDHAKKQRELLQEWAAAIRIPFFGIVIDTNDATLLGGFTLWIIMMWLRLSLWRQCSNLSMAFSQAVAAERLPFAYRYASMQQVLSVPPATADGDPRVRSPRPAPSVLFCLPATVQLIAFSHDLLTFGIVSKDSTIWHALPQTIIAFVLLVLIGYLTWRCHQLRNESKRMWVSYFAMLGPTAAAHPSAEIDTEDAVA